MATAEGPRPAPQAAEVRIGLSEGAYDEIGRDGAHLGGQAEVGLASGAATRTLETNTSADGR